jgi:hypothetical protein
MTAISNGLAKDSANLLAVCRKERPIGRYLLTAAFLFLQPLVLYGQSGPIGRLNAPSGSTSQKGGTGSQHDTDQARELTASIAATVDALGHFEDDCSEPEEDIALPARALITTLKHQLRDLIVVTIRSSRAGSAAELKQNLLMRLLSFGVRVQEPDSDPSPPDPGCRFQYGVIYGVDITDPNDDPDLLVATTSLAVECGEDTSLYVFERHHGSWNLAISRESNGYENVAGAQGQLQYSVSPRDDKGTYFLVSADVSPWCTSNWQEIRYRAERPRNDPAAPATIVAGKDIIFLGDDSGPTLTTAADSFRLEYSGEFRGDGGRLVRRHVLAFHISGNRAERVAPVAAEPEEFVDEWVTLPWELASKWSSPGNISVLRGWYEDLRPAGDEYASLGEVDFVRQCSDGKWLIGRYVRNAESSAGDLPGELYFKVSETDSVYNMEEISSTEDASCVEASFSSEALSAKR